VVKRKEQTIYSAGGNDNWLSAKSESLAIFKSPKEWPCRQVDKKI
jgi:hypothetical protein